MSNHIDFSVILAGGPVMIPLALVSLFLWYLIIRDFLIIRRAASEPPLPFPLLIQKIKQGEKNKVIGLLENHPGVISRILRRGIMSLDQGKEPARNAISEAVARELPEIGRSVPTIGALASAAPLLGLLGTIAGMITTFEVISFSGTGEPEYMAGGISQALITTQTGLIVGIPGILFYVYLSSRINSLRKKIGLRIESLLANID